MVASTVPQAGCYSQTDIELPPIEYSDTQDNNLVTELMKNLKTGETTLEYDGDFGYLKSLLKAFDIPMSSQVLVFSKTSMQINFISPRSPRAIYFNDDVYVGWVRGSSIMEISTSDPKLGAAFYTVEMTPRRARIKRELYSCLACHTSTLTQGVPGHTVRSVMPKPDGSIEVQRKSFVTDHSSPLPERWGGWYVTGTQGKMSHMGNAVLRGDQLVADGSANRSNLRNNFNTFNWLTPYSDIVALMVLEHQTQMHNAFTLANFTVRQTIHEHEQSHAPSGQDETQSAENDVRRRELQITVERAAKKVVDYMLFVDEAPLTAIVTPSTSFAKDFSDRGPKDQSGRSLRDFDLRSRMFRHPCSYLIYSPSFDALEDDLKEQIYLRLWNVLIEGGESKEYDHLNVDVRESILQILKATKTALPSYWTNATAVHE
ncbi:MAG: hypothetical protein GY768_05400 [Planctomycetaceae bacterium]|nr:hypothetical protein [Planctomycetaceae bacterium]